MVFSSSNVYATNTVQGRDWNIMYPKHVYRQDQNTFAEVILHYHVFPHYQHIYLKAKPRQALIKSRIIRATLMTHRQCSGALSISYLLSL